jgi:hypothetical protein
MFHSSLSKQLFFTLLLSLTHSLNFFQGIFLLDLFQIALANRSARVEMLSNIQSSKTAQQTPQEDLYKDSPHYRVC